MFWTPKAGSANANALSGRGWPFAIAAFLLGISATAVIAEDGTWTPQATLCRSIKLYPVLYLYPPLSVIYKPTKKSFRRIPNVSARVPRETAGRTRACRQLYCLLTTPPQTAANGISKR